MKKTRSIPTHAMRDPKERKGRPKMGKIQVQEFPGYFFSTANKKVFDCRNQPVKPYDQYGVNYKIYRLTVPSGRISIKDSDLWEKVAKDRASDF